MLKTTTAALLVALGLLAGCSNNDDPASAADPLPLEELYSVNGQDIVCTGPVAEEGYPAAGPFMDYVCTWSNVTVEGQPKCYAIVLFHRENGAAAWGAPFVIAGEHCL